ncbi:MAG: hypothetical protein WAM82_03560 [Thermoanaerobaculia bacterium]
MRAQTRPFEGLDADLTRLIRDLESLDPRRRPTAGETAERLRWILDKPQRVRRLRVAALTGAFVFLLAVLAVVSWLAVREILSPLLQGKPDEPTRGLIAEAEVTRGRIEAALGTRDEARAAWERALAILAPCSRPLTHWKVLAPWTEALLRLGRTGEARPGVEQLARMGYRSEDLARLWREKGGGEPL